MESAFKDWDYIEGMIDSAYHEAALKMNLSDSEFSILYIFNEHQEGCNQSAIRKMEKKELLYLTPGSGRNTQVFLTEKGKKLMEDTVYRVIEIENEIYNDWTPEERELFMKLNRDFAEKLSDKVKKLPAL